MIVLRTIHALNRAIGKAVSFLIWAGIVVLCYEVVARYAFGRGSGRTARRNGSSAHISCSWAPGR
jgi:TRAP-type mannitol/chloroaromatic compound transport system permease small subunit